jgi:malonyl-CoA O-methyltransferase
MKHNDALALDKHRVRAAFERATMTYDAAAVLQREIADRLLGRLDLLKHAPTRILDAGCGTGYSTRALARRYPRADVYALDLAHGMTTHARRAGARWWGDWARRERFVCGDAESLPLAAASVDMVYSNLVLQWCDAPVVFAEFLRVLRPGGVLMFSSFGPDTLYELRAAWAAVDAAAHVHAFVDMHDLGDALLHASYAEPVMDAERLTLTYRDVAGVLRDLKAIGAHNAARARSHALTGKQRFARMQAAYEAQRRADGSIPATYEVVYGHAWAPQRAVVRPPAGDGVMTLQRWPRRDLPADGER